MHLFFEAHFVIYHTTIAGRQGLFDQLWKEYSLSDSRYLTSDAFLISMEAVTAVSGLRSEILSARLTIHLVLLGTAGFPHRLLYYRPAPYAPCVADCHLLGPGLW